MTPEGNGLSEHEEFRALAAMATTGALTVSEAAELRAHLSACAECRNAYREYQVLAKDGASMLAAGYEHWEAGEDWDHTPVRDTLLTRLRVAEPFDSLTNIQQPASKGGSPWRGWARKIPGAVLAACLVAGVGFGAFRLGSARRMDLFAEKQSLVGAVNAQTQRLARLEGEVFGKEQQIRELHSRLKGRSAELAKLTAGAQEQLRTSWEQHQERLKQLSAQYSNEIAGIKAAAEEKLRAAWEQRDALSTRLHDLQQSYQTAEAELARLRNERDKAALRLAALTREATELSAANQDHERRLKSQDRFLAADRDIRELMGARQLYIADVFDVSSDSRTRKPYGRVFYTKGKSLIFYAFDLDRQPSVKGAAFQAWGRNEALQERPMNLGVLYLDNEANRRWLLRCDDPKQLAEIDAVFVTVEPHGGSQKPTGRPFLYASLRRQANHQ